jgi:hypothetical protein
MKEFVHRNPVRVAAFISSAVALVITAISPDLPVEQAVVLVLSFLGLGEYAQRKENEKTLDALYTDVDDLETADEE